MKGYQDLDIYKIAFELSVKVHHLSLKLPAYELYETGSQVRRSSKSVTTNIVEGYGRKRYKADFIKFLTYAHASCDETLLHLTYIENLHLKNEPELLALKISYIDLSKKIFNFIQFVEKNWNSSKE
jgi:four helix bundle protein